MRLFRLLFSGAGLIVGFIGFMNVTFAWMNGTRADLTSWATVIIGAITWFSGRANDACRRKEGI
ncbi:hypothetical protein ACVWZM_003035 [Bradyrhizobium sp. USDA 4501]